MKPLYCTILNVYLIYGIHSKQSYSSVFFFCQIQINKTVQNGIKAKKKFVSICDQDCLFHECYDGLDEDEEYFLGNQFTREDDAKSDFGWSNSSNDYSDNEIAHDNNELVEDMFEANEGFLGKI